MSWMDKAKSQIRSDEGVRDHIYKDSLGNPTVGIGHKVLPSDTDFQNKTQYVDKFSNEVIQKHFDKDFNTAMNGAKNVINNTTPKDSSRFDRLPDPAKETLTNMSFQLGQGGLSGFKKMNDAIAKEDYSKAANEMKDSKWNRQTPARSDRLIEKMKQADK